MTDCCSDSGEGAERFGAQMEELYESHDTVEYRML